MTEDEKEKIIAAKQEVSEWLANVDLSRYKLGRVDKRLSAYVRRVAHNPQDHNVFEQLGVRHFLRMMEKYGIEVRIVKMIFYLYEHLTFPSTEGPRSFELTEVQCFQFASIYGFWDGDKRIVKEACLYVPRKFSKTTSSAFFVVYDLLFGDGNAEGYVGANSQDQAKKCFEVIRMVMQHLDPREEFYTINQMAITSKRTDRNVLAQCLTANARTKDGLNASTVVMDEFSQAKDASLLYVLTTSMGVRKNPLTVFITTASDMFDGPFYQQLLGYMSLLMGEYDDDSVFAYLCMPDYGDREDDEHTWFKVHPHLGITVSLDFYRREYLGAVRGGAEKMLAFRTKLLNIYAENQTRSWISASLARRISRPMPLDGIVGKPPAFAAVDLSVSGDFSAVSMAMYSKESQTFSIHTAYFFPKGALKGHPNEKLYRKWAYDKYLILQDGDVIDYEKIVEYILGLTEHVTLLQVGYDPYKSQEMINMLRASAKGAQKSVVPVKQTYGHFTSPVELFEHGAKTGHIFINDNPINWYCFGNAILDSDRLENVKPIKRSENNRIDGVITMLMCLRLNIDYVRG